VEDRNKIVQYSLIILAFFVILFISASAMAATHYISSNGSASWAESKNISTPCSLETANANVNAGDTLNMRSGMYTTAINPTSSGSSGNPITFQRYPGDAEYSVIIKSYPGVNLNSNSWIIIDGIYFRDCVYWVKMTGATNNVIQNSKFYNSFSYAGMNITSDSNDNQFLNNVFLDSPLRSSPIYWDQACQDAWNAQKTLPSNCDGKTAPQDYFWIKDSSGNLISESTFGNVSHGAIEFFEAEDNIVRNSTIENKYHSGIIVNSKTNGDSRALIENNIIKNVGSLWDVNPVKASRDYAWSQHAIQQVGRYGIIRNNQVYNSGTGIMASSYTTFDQHRYSSYSRIYNNTIYNNLRNFDIEMNGDCVEDVIVKNNIFEGAEEREIDNRSYINGCNNYFINNNWSGDVSNFYYKGKSRQTLAQLISSFPTELDSSNSSESANSTTDEGAWLTTITSSTGSGSTFTVHDPLWFYDGWSISGEAGDVIKTENGQIAKIISINYDNGLIEVDRSISWTNGEGIGLDYKDLGPDIGANENPSDSSVNPPKNLTILAN